MPSRELTQQGQHGLRDLVGLRQDGGAGLLQDLGPRHVGHFHRVVGVFDARARSRQVGDGVVQVGDGRFEAVLDRAQVAAHLVDAVDGGVDFLQRAAADGGHTAGGHERQAAGGDGGGAAQQRVDLSVSARDRDGFVVVGADLNGQFVVAGQDLDAVELRLRGNAVDFVQALGDFVLDRFEIGVRIRSIGRLNRKFADALQIVVDLGQRAFRRLGDGDPVVRVACGLGQALDVGREAVGNGLAGGVVLGAVDAQARGQAFDRRTQSGLGLVQVVLGDQSKVVSVDNRSAWISMN